MKKGKKCIAVLFALYCVILAFVLFFPGLHGDGPFTRSYNLVPLATVCEMVQGLADGSLSTRVVFNNLGINILMFLPMGMALPALFRCTEKFGMTLPVCFCATAFAEGVQFACNLGTFDVDDILLNTLGGVCGYGIVCIPVVKDRLRRLF